MPAWGDGVDLLAFYLGSLSPEPEGSSVPSHDSIDAGDCRGLRSPGSSGHSPLHKNKCLLQLTGRRRCRRGPKVAVDGLGPPVVALLLHLGEPGGEPVVLQENILPALFEFMLVDKGLLEFSAETVNPGDELLPVKDADVVEAGLGLGRGRRMVGVR